MTPRDFVYWLRGYIELSGDNIENGLDAEQVKMINTHLDLVFQIGGQHLQDHIARNIDGSWTPMSCSLAPPKHRYDVGSAHMTCSTMPSNRPPEHLSKSNLE